MRNNSPRIASVWLALLLWPQVASALIPVTDAANIVQTAATALNTFNQLQKQKEQMEKDFIYMTKQLQSLKELGWEDSYKLRQHLDFFDSLKGKVDSLTFDYRQMDEKFRNLYSGKDKSVEQKLSDWNAQSERSMLAAMKSHGVINDSNRKMESVASLVEKQRRAQGDLAALQTLGELTAILSQQLEELKTIITLDSRAKQSQAMEASSQKSVVAEQEKYLISDLRKKEKYKKITKLPNLGQGTK